MWEWICAGWIVGVGAWVVSRLRGVRRAFSDEHILEVATGLVTLKEGALSHIDREVNPHDDQRVLRTGAGLAVVYTISVREPGNYVHHASVSIPDGHTPGAIGQTFLLLWARLLCLPRDRLVLTFSQSSVHHAEVALTSEEQQEFMERSVEALTLDQIRGLFNELQEARPTLHWTRIEDDA